MVHEECRMLCALFVTDDVCCVVFKRRLHGARGELAEHRAVKACAPWPECLISCWVLCVACHVPCRSPSGVACVAQGELAESIALGVHARIDQQALPIRAYVKADLSRHHCNVHKCRLCATCIIRYASWHGACDVQHTVDARHRRYRQCAPFAPQHRPAGLGTCELT
jgi:hypothetical protein